MKIRTYLLVFALAMLLPMIAFSAIAVIDFDRQQRAAVERGGVETARALVNAVDRELSASLTTLQTLATARSLESATTLRLKRAGADDFEDLPIERSGEVYELAKQAQASIQGFRSGKPLVSAEEGRAAVAVCLAAEASANQGGRPIAVD